MLSASVCSTHDPTTTPSATPPPHRGAARQMYGSGSLRPPGSKPSHAINQKQPKTPATPSQPFPVPIRFQDFAFDKLPQGFPILVPLAPGVTSRNRGGMYGGRPEYYGMRRPSTGGLIGGRHPLDLGFIPGRGYANGPGARKQGVGLNRVGLGPIDQYMRQPEEDEVSRDRQYDHGCGEDCPSGEFLCVESCVCIKDTHR